MKAVKVHGGCELFERISRRVGRRIDAGPDALGIATLSGLELKLSSESCDMVVSCGPWSAASHPEESEFIVAVVLELIDLVSVRFEVLRVIIMARKLCLFEVNVTSSECDAECRRCGRELTLRDASLSVRALDVPDRNRVSTEV